MSFTIFTVSVRKILDTIPCVCVRVCVCVCVCVCVYIYIYIYIYINEYREDFLGIKEAGA